MAPRQLKQAASRVVQYFTTHRSTVGLYEMLFEHSPHPLANLLVKLQKQPDFDFAWTVHLLNGKKVCVPITRDDPRSWEFAHAYHWHDVGLRNVELLIHQYYGDDEVFFDVGANLGVRSLLPLSMGKHCVLFEPNVRLRSFTEEVFRRNSFGGYEIHNICLSDQVGVQQFFLSESSYTSSLHKENAEAFGRVEETSVSTTTLDAWCDARGSVNHPTVVKIDVEGAEYEVLAGASRVLEEDSPVILIELLGSPLDRQRSVDLLTGLGYQSFGILNGSRLKLVKLSPANWPSFNATTNYLFAKDNSLINRFQRYLQR